MLFIESKILNYAVEGAERIGLLNALQEQGLSPSIRSMRRNYYESMLPVPEGDAGEQRLNEMERAIAAWTETEMKCLYVQGDLFYFDDYVLFLIFGSASGGRDGMRAGIIYETETMEPLRRLDSFCQEVADALDSMRKGDRPGGRDGEMELPEWQRSRPLSPTGFARFVAKQDIDTLSTILRRETAVERIHAAELLEDENTRLFIRRAREAQIEGFAGKLLVGRKNEGSKFSTGKLIESGLLRREVSVSCRQTGHTMFNLPSPDALAVVTVSKATCSECGELVANEKVEEALVPTALAAALLQDGSWLVNRLYSIIRRLGVPESEIAVGPVSGYGESHMMANVCGEPFLFVLRDGDLTPAFARRAIDLTLEMDAPHLFVVATGTIHNEGRIRLLDFSRLRVSGGKEFGVSIVEGAGTMAVELGHAFERVSQKAIAEQLCELDASLGLNIGHLIVTRFQLMRQRGLIRTFPKSSAVAPPARNRHNITSAQPLISL